MAVSSNTLYNATDLVLKFNNSENPLVRDREVSKDLTLKEIDSLKSINDISIQEIKKRSKTYTSSRFLGLKELFKDCLKRDRITVHKKLNTTHIELANHLYKLSGQPLGLCFHNPSEVDSNTLTRKCFNPLSMVAGILAVTCLVGCVGLLKPYLQIVTTVYAVATAFFAGIAFLSFKYSLIWISREQHRGLQDDFFDTNDYAGQMMGQKWSSVTYIRHLNAFGFRKFQITDGGQRYVRRIGFYQGGGPSNPYRIDPETLHKVLTA